MCVCMLAGRVMTLTLKAPPVIAEIHHICGQDTFLFDNSAVAEYL